MNKLLKRTRMFPLLLVVLSLLFVALPIGVAYVAQLFEHYNPDPGSTSGITIHNKYWQAQTFTAESAHSVTSLRLRFYKSHPIDPGNVTVSMQGTDGSGHPNGTELASETIEGITLPNLWDWIDCDYCWTEIIFTTPCNLTKDQKYAIVVRAPSADTNQGTYLVWAGYHDFFGEYPGGNVERSSDSGFSWDGKTDHDVEFEVYGEETPPPAPAVGGEVYPVNKIALVAPWITLTAIIAGGIGILLIRRKAYR